MQSTALSADICGYQCPLRRYSILARLAICAGALVLLLVAPTQPLCRNVAPVTAKPPTPVITNSLYHMWEMYRLCIYILEWPAAALTGTAYRANILLFSFASLPNKSTNAAHTLTVCLYLKSVLCGVSAFSLCLCVHGFSPVGGRLRVKERQWLCVSVRPCDELVTCPMCHPAFAQ